VTAPEQVSTGPKLEAPLDGAAEASAIRQPHNLQLQDLLPPASFSPANAAAILVGPRLTPKQYLWFYSPDEWEEFIREWASLLSPSYLHVKRLGGANDRGIDIAGLLSHAGLEGDWDCYQCKHYDRPLEPADARTEILKIFSGVIDRAYVMPRRYRFVAPRGCGPTLTRQLSTPSRFQADFLANLDPSKPLCKDLSDETIEAVRELAKQTDFTIFGCEDIDGIISLHRGAPNHLVRFGGQLPSRPRPDYPPDEPASHETRYVAQLIEVYDERFPGHNFSPEVAAADAQTSDHFLRQREAFYSAEALRVFARDSVPDGTFTSLQDEVFDGVVETLDQSYRDGFERLSRVLGAAGSLNLTSNALIAVTEQRDRKGICHQLANDDRLVWTKKPPQ
jgi:hypothetical protein